MTKVFEDMLFSMKKNILKQDIPHDDEEDEEESEREREKETSSMNIYIKQ